MLSPTAPGTLGEEFAAGLEPGDTWRRLSPHSFPTLWLGYRAARICCFLLGPSGQCLEGGSDFSWLLESVSFPISRSQPLSLSSSRLTCLSS